MSVALYLCLKSLAGAIGCFTVGVFIDLDHFHDYFMHSRSRAINLKQFFDVCHNMKLSKLYLVFHSYEIIPLLFLAGVLTGWNGLTIGMTTGFILHLLLDELINKKKYAGKPLFYFFTYRLIKGFRRELLASPPHMPRCARD